ncbi:ABC transporter ATP-binding protein [Desulforudis sp. 1088]|uniref:ABC transporter ATP-binding protein n=1 Tax=unclassified Candidatus Desulforudis TaxID=2635950 RepID=UPI003CE4B84F
MSSNDIAIRVSNLSKCYFIYDRPQDRLKQSIIPRLQRLVGRQPKNYFREFWALRDVSFEVKKGETVGIIGRNGSGKSTLLQIICGTLTPTSGTVETNGRIAALLELGSGFNPEFTGRENVYMNGAVLGLSKEEIDARFDDIAAFADIGEFMEQPVKTYSSGMYVRLAFAVNIMSQPEIMIVDEALAVGDMNFQAKCMTALTRIQKAGATVLFVSHDIGAVKSLCSRAIHLERGELKSVGTAADVAEHYVRMMREEMNEEQRRFVRIPTTFPAIKEKTESTSPPTQCKGFKESEDFDRRVEQFRYGSGGARVTYVELLNTDDEPINSVEFNQEVRIKIYFKSHSDLDVSPNYYILDDKKNLILGAGPRTLGKPIVHARKDARYVVTYTTNLPLQEGIYSIQIQLTKPVIVDETAEFLDVIDDAIVFNVTRKREGRVWAKVLLPNSYGCIEI